MATWEKLHHLIQAIHQARVFAYCILALIFASRLLYTEATASYTFFLAFLLAFPYLHRFICGRIRNDAIGARYGLLSDGALVGIMIVLAEFSLLVSVAIIAALVMGTLMVAKPKMLTINPGVVMTSCGLSYIVLDPNISTQG
jgi:hypothetical protein|tara:strand:+ start:766 stop:1191 length:426 start_codon:yes stop_codon:yes gene_type:complete